MPDVTWANLARECHCRLDDPIAGQESTFDDGDRALVADIAKYGWHIVHIPDEPQSSGWVFSVGMWHTLGSPELAVFGLRANDAANLINLVGDRVRSGHRIGPSTVLTDVLEGDRPVTFRPADSSWYQPLFGYATWFGQRPPLPIVQAVWADPDGRFPWTEGIEDWYRFSQPSLWIPASEHPQGRWSGTLISGAWPFTDPPNTTAFTTKRIAFENRPILSVVHETDGDWDFLDGQEVAEGGVSLVHLAHIVGAHKGIAELADLPRGWEAFRESEQAPWIRRVLSDDLT